MVADVISDHEIDRRIKAWQNGDSNDQEIDGLTALVRELQEERSSGSFYATLPAHVAVCETCGTGQGYIWPTASDGHDDHYYVERCDACDRFESDDAAADYIAGRLGELGLAYDRGEADIGLSVLQPYVENIEERRTSWKRLSCCARPVI